MRVIFRSRENQVQVLYNPYRQAHYEVYVEGSFVCGCYTEQMAVSNAVAFAKDMETV